MLGDWSVPIDQIPIEKELGGTQINVHTITHKKVKVHSVEIFRVHGSKMHKLFMKTNKEHN